MNYQPLNNFFDKIYVITLYRAVERQEKIKTVLTGLNYSFFYGADKKEFSIEELKAKKIYDEAKAMQHHRYSKPMNGGQIGCARSHAMIYEDIIKNNYQKALILEDDAVPSEHGINTFTAVINELPADWEMLYLDYAKNENAPATGFLKKIVYHLQHTLGVLKWNHQMISNLYAKKISAHIAKAGFHDYTDAYAVTNTGAKKLLQLQTPISFVADNLLAHASTNEIVKTYITLPKIFEQESQQSGKPSFSYVEE